MVDCCRLTYFGCCLLDLFWGMDTQTADRTNCPAAPYPTQIVDCHQDAMAKHYCTKQQRKRTAKVMVKTVNDKRIPYPP